MKKRNHNITIKKILLAAGSSRRYGNKNKLTEKFKGKYLIQHIRDTLLKVFHSSELLVIVGHDYETIKNLINNKDIKIINNKNYKNGIHKISDFLIGFIAFRISSQTLGLRNNIVVDPVGAQMNCICNGFVFFIFVANR